ncbi:MAG: flagellar motor protein MotB [Clostridiaceae bacterium]|nr:flagellar motor protein MotB [Clostridiaceae bacterium]
MKKRVEKENGERWLLSYADFITLLMIFFLVMYAMSNVDSKKYAQVAASLNSALGDGQGAALMLGQGGTSNDIIAPVDNPSVQADSTKAEENKLKDLKNQVDKYLENNGIKASASAVIQERGLVISISDTLIFDSGQADLKPNSESKLVEIGKMLNTINNYVVIEGNTDNVPISTYQFKDNWSLASARADNVTRALINKANIPPVRIASRSNGEYRPVAANSSESGRAANRRVDIVILDNKYSSTESNQTK